MQTSSVALTEPIPTPETAEDAVMSLMMALGRRLRQRQPGDAIDYSAFPLLKLLSHQGPMRLSALASVLGLDASTVSRHARQLEDRGLLERTGDPDDGRASPRGRRPPRGCSPGAAPPPPPPASAPPAAPSPPPHGGGAGGGGGRRS